MQNVKRLMQWGWRSLFVIGLTGTAMFLVGTVAARQNNETAVEPFTLVGNQYKLVDLIPNNQRLANATVQAILIRTSDSAFNDIVNNAVTAKVKAFEAALPPTPATVGFYHQLRVVPRIDYSSKERVSLTLQTDEYHPMQPVTSHYDSWLKTDSRVSQPVLTKSLAKQLTKVLHLPDNDLLSHTGEIIALGLLPNYTVRLYSEGALAHYINSSYIDASLYQLPALAKLYRSTFYAQYPNMLRPAAQVSLTKNFTSNEGHARGSTNCEISSCIALTFDDGPDPVITPKIIDILDTNAVKGTFFELGSQVVRSPEISQHIAKGGHEIENHSFGHPDFVKLQNPALIRQQIDQTQATLANLGILTKFLRPPYGSIDSHVQSVVNMPIILWNIDTQEWRPGTTPESIAANIVLQARPGAIILMHDTKPITVDALPLVISQLKARGYSMVTVQELLKIDANSRGIFAAQ